VLVGKVGGVGGVEVEGDVGVAEEEAHVGVGAGDGEGEVGVGFDEVVGSGAASDLGSNRSAVRRSRTTQEGLADVGS